MVGVGYGKAKEVPAAIQKGAEEARKNFFRVPMVGGTITHPVQGRDAAGIVMMKPAFPVPVLSLVALLVQFLSVLVSRTSCRSLSAPIMPSTSSAQPWMAFQSSWSALKRLPHVVASPWKRSLQPVCCASAQDRRHNPMALKITQVKGLVGTEAKPPRKH